MQLGEIHRYLSNKKLELNEGIFEELKKLKEQAIKEQKEEVANEIWCLETIGNIQCMYLNMFYQLKENKYENYFEAWRQLEQIDIQLSFLRENYDYSCNKFGLLFIENIIKEYEKLFPYEYFMSRESIIKREKCSICNRISTIRNRCEHKIGKLYMGEICTRIVEDFDFLGVAIVKNPFDKYTVLFPQDKEYNYFMLENLMPLLNTPYDRWYVDVLKDKKPEYKDVGRNDLCSCGSKKKYKKCCLGTDNEYVNHHRITLIDNPTAEHIPFTLGNTWK